MSITKRTRGCWKEKGEHQEKNKKFIVWSFYFFLKTQSWSSLQNPNSLSHPFSQDFWIGGRGRIKSFPYLFIYSFICHLYSIYLLNSSYTQHPVPGPEDRRWVTFDNRPQDAHGLSGRLVNHLQCKEGHRSEPGEITSGPSPFLSKCQIERVSNPVYWERWGRYKFNGTSVFAALSNTVIITFYKIFQKTFTWSFQSWLK